MSNDKTENKDSHQKDETTESSPSGQTLGDRDPDIAGKQPGQKQNPSNQSDPKWWQFSSQGVFNFLIVVIYACQAHIMNGQWSAMENQLVEMRNSSVDTKTVAEAARKSADTGEKALALSIRPQLTVERIFDLVLVPERGVELKLQLANTGNGSAKSPSSTILFGTCPREAGGECFDACPTKTDPKRTIPGSWGNIDPKTSVKWAYQDYSLTSAEEIESITTGTRLLYVCGIHSYTDLFSNPYDSFFCFGYDGSVKRWAGCGIGPQSKEKKNTK